MQPLELEKVLLATVATYLSILLWSLFSLTGISDKQERSCIRFWVLYYGKK